VTHRDLVILKETRIKYKNEERKALIVQCLKCKEDPELYGDAIYTVLYDNFKKGQKPCGCSRNPKRTKEQWKIILKRKAKSNNHIFLGFIDDGRTFNQNTYISLHCNNCGHNWNSASIGNYTNNRGCPSCANESRVISKTTSSEEWVNRFLKTGQFDNYEFYRQQPSGRLWNVICHTCGTDKMFQSDRSNLVAGKIPCDCKLGGGFNKRQKSYFYLFKIKGTGHTCCKYGISNYPERRIASHKRELLRNGLDIESLIVFTGDGNKILEYESSLKREIPKINLDISGFKKEVTTIDHYEKILTKCDELDFVRQDINVT
jgi:RNase P subunit RPR2